MKTGDRNGAHDDGNAAGNHPALGSALDTLQGAGVNAGAGATPSVQSAARFDYEVTAPDEIPRHLMVVDEAKVRAEIAAGARAMAGLRIFEVK